MKKIDRFRIILIILIMFSLGVSTICGLATLIAILIPLATMKVLLTVFITVLIISVVLEVLIFEL